MLRGFALKHGLAIVCDEVFLDYPAEGVASPGTWAGEANVMTFVLSGLSKVALAPQLKLGWIVVAGPATSTLEACRRLEHIASSSSFACAASASCASSSSRMKVA